MKVSELRSLAKDLGIRGHTTANKERLISLIETHQKTNNVDERNKAWKNLTEEKSETKESFEDTKENAENAEKPRKCKCNHGESDTSQASKPAKDQKKKPSKGANPWNLHLRKYREDNPGKSLKQAMGEARESYHASKK